MLEIYVSLSGPKPTARLYASELRLTAKLQAQITVWTAMQMAPASSENNVCISWSARPATSGSEPLRLSFWIPAQASIPSRLDKEVRCDEKRLQGQPG